MTLLYNVVLIGKLGCLLMVNDLTRVLCGLAAPADLAAEIVKVMLN